MRKLIYSVSLLASMIFAISLSQPSTTMASTDGYLTTWKECPGKHVKVKRCEFGSGDCQASHQLLCNEFPTIDLQ